MVFHLMANKIIQFEVSWMQSKTCIIGSSLECMYLFKILSCCMYLLLSIHCHFSFFRLLGCCFLLFYNCDLFGRCNQHMLSLHLVLDNITAILPFPR